MNKLLLSFTFFVITNLLFAQGIKFEHGTFQDALDKAKVENKLVFMDCYTSWCVPCKWMATEIFTQEEVGNFFNQNFVNIKVDMEKGEGPALMKKYPQVKAFPTLLFIQPDGNVVHTVVGGGDENKLMGEAKNALDPSQRANVLHEKYSNCERSPEFLVAYLGLLSNEGEREKVSTIANEHLATLSNEDLIDKYNFQMLRMIGLEYGSKRHQFIKKHKAEFAKISSDKDVDQLLFYAHTNYVGHFMRKPDITYPELDKAMQEYREAYPDKGKNIARIGYKEYYLRHKMYDQYIELVDQYVADDLANNEMDGFYSMVSAVQPIALNAECGKVKGANEWAIKNCEKAIAISPKETDPYFYLAAIYKRKNNKELAVKYANIYLEKMKAKGMEPKHDKLTLIDEIRTM